MKRLLIPIFILSLAAMLGATDFSLNPARDFGAIRRIDPVDYDGKNVVREDGTGLSSDTAEAFRNALEVFSKVACNASDALNLRLDGSRAMTGNLKFSGNYSILRDTSDGADNAVSFLAGGGGWNIGRGAVVETYGNEHANAGQLRLYAGNVSTGDHIFYTGSGTERFRIRYDGTSDFDGSVAIHAPATGTLKVYGYSSDVSSGNDNNLNGQILLGNSSAYQGRISYGGGKSGQECVYIVNTYNSNNGGILFRTKASATPVDAMKITGDGRVLIGTTTDDGTNKLQVNGSMALSSFATLASPTAVPTGVEGRVYYNGTEKKLKLYNGSAWVNL